MFKIKLCIAILFLCVTSIVAQKSINDYKYVIVPIQYDFQKTEDAYQLNSLTKFLFNKAGFQAFLSNEDYPEDLNNNGCLAMTARLKNSSKMLSTNMNFDLVDCNNKVIFSSVEAKSKEKEYKTAYHDCTRKTFESIKAQNYSYSVPTSKAVETTVVAVQQQVTSTSEVEFQAPVKQATVSKTNVVIPVVATTTVVKSETKPSTKEAVAEVIVDNSILYAQPTSTGFQLVDSTPKVVYVLLKTSVKDMYLVSGNNNNGIIYKTNGVWKVDYYNNGKLVSKELNLKFF